MSPRPATESRFLPTLRSTRSLANSIALELGSADVLFLSGELGSGKTTFIRYLAAAIGIDPSWVSSPSFTIVQKYPSGAKGLGLTHIDLYRMGSAPELEGLGLDEIWRSPDLVAVEWPELLEGEPMPSERRTWRIGFGSAEDGRRFASLKRPKSF